MLLSSKQDKHLMHFAFSLSLATQLRLLLSVFLYYFCSTLRAILRVKFSWVLKVLSLRKIN